MIRALGLGPFRTIHIPAGMLDGLTPAERCAVVLHELGHLYHRHPGKRLMRLLNPLRWHSLAERAKADELEADAFCASFGFGQALALFLERFPDQTASGPFHPSAAERIARLKQHHRLVGATGPIALRPSRAKEIA